MTRLALHRFDTVESTNDVALRMAREGAPDGTVVLARAQTCGRGRRGRKWLDQPGDSVLMSVIAGRGGPVDEAWRFSFAASLAVRDCLCDTCGVGEVSLKWPNDVLARERKIAGILTETILPCAEQAADPSDQNRGLSAAVVGIGINVGQRRFPDELADAATSVLIESGEAPPVDTLAELVARTFLDLCDSLAMRGPEALARVWARHMWGLGRQVEIDTDERVIRGRIGGVDSQGSLIIIEANGRTGLVRAADAIRAAW